jgi:cell division septum initiation protein DivIVA
MSIFLRPPRLTGNLFVDRVVRKRDETHAEIYALREELQVLKDVIRSKQERLRKMNRAIILRQNSTRYLRLVSSTPGLKTEARHTRSPGNHLRLHCENIDSQSRSI